MDNGFTLNLAQEGEYTEDGEAIYFTDDLRYYSLFSSQTRYVIVAEVILGTMFSPKKGQQTRNTEHEVHTLVYSPPEGIPEAAPLSVTVTQVHKVDVSKKLAFEDGDAIAAEGEERDELLEGVVSQDCDELGAKLRADGEEAAGCAAEGPAICTHSRQRRGGVTGGCFRQFAVFQSEQASPIFLVDLEQAGLKS